MIGFLAINEDGAACFAQLGQHQRIAALRILPGPCCVVSLADGSEEMFTHEIHGDLIEALNGQTEAIIGHFDDDGEIREEYSVPLLTMA